MSFTPILRKVRQQKPLIHNITNVVVTNFTANGLLALGASPVMAYAIEEVADMAQLADALVLNIGTLNSNIVESMIIAGKAANEKGVPVILDPVGAGATSYRTKTVERILNEVNVSVIRGNAAEIANVAGQGWRIKGVDSGGKQGNVVELAQTTAQKFNMVVAITGQEDIISDGIRTNIVKHGHILLTQVTGAGCLLTSIVGAFNAVEQDRLTATTAAMTYFGIAGEKAAMMTESIGPGSFQIELLNQLSASNLEDWTTIHLGGTKIETV